MFSIIFLIISQSSIFSYSIFISSLFSLLSFAFFKSNLSIKRLNLRVWNFSRTASLSHSFTFNSPKSLLIGESVSMVPSVLERNALSLSFSSFPFNFPFILSMLAYTSSIVLYSFIRLIAVFSPTPATPGILSEVSPANPLT